MACIPSNKSWLFTVRSIYHWPVFASSRISNGAPWAVPQLIIYISARSRILLRSPEDETILILRVVPLYGVRSKLHC